MTFLIVAYVVVGLVVALAVGVATATQAPPRDGDVGDHVLLSFLCLLAGAVWPMVLLLAGFAGLLLCLVKMIDRRMEGRR